MGCRRATRGSRASATRTWSRGGSGLTDTFALAMRVGAFAHSIAWVRQRDHLPESEVPDFDRWFPLVLRRAAAQTLA